MTERLVRIDRAIVSVFDKKDLELLSEEFQLRGVQVLSTGGTAKKLENLGCSVRLVEQETRFPEMLDGRLKTLHPMVHGGLLGVRSNPAHVAAMKEHGIQPVNLLVVNLYPFEQVIEKPHTLEDAIENIDIGGPAMVRAAAKNHPDVAVVTDPRQYKHLLREMKAHDGCTSLDFRRKLMVEAFVLTAAYDAAVSEYFGQKFNHNYFTRTQGAKALGANR